MRTVNRTTGARLRIVLEPGVALGPGKADLLAGIVETGSIAASGRRLGMSYKRAWQLVEELNRTFREPLVGTAKGGAQGGGAHLTPLGEEVLRRLRAMQAGTEAVIADDLAALRAALRPPGTPG